MNSDTYQTKGLRHKLTEEIARKGINDTAVLDAVNSVPRHRFIDSGFAHLAYKDRALPIAAGQTISQPFTVAFQTELLQVKKFDKVLEVGTGSGYQAAVLLAMGAKVYTIERQRELYLKTRTLLREMNYKPQFFYGDGYKGLPTYAPFDSIIITAGAEEIPEALIEQLKPGGRMVVPVGSRDTQEMYLLEKDKDGQVNVTNHGNFVFVPMLKGVEK